MGEVGARGAVAHARRVPRSGGQPVPRGRRAARLRVAIARARSSHYGGARPNAHVPRAGRGRYY